MKRKFFGELYYRVMVASAIVITVLMLAAFVMCWIPALADSANISLFDLWRDMAALEVIPIAMWLLRDWFFLDSDYR